MNTDNTNRDAEPSPASAGSRPFPKVAPDRLLEILRMNCESGDILCGDAADEIERLRLTDEEREAVSFFAEAGVYWATGEGVGHARRLLGMLKRLG